jgi:hypothetical protein
MASPGSTALAVRQRSPEHIPGLVICDPSKRRFVPGPTSSPDGSNVRTLGFR